MSWKSSVCAGCDVGRRREPQLRMMSCWLLHASMVRTQNIPCPGSGPKCSSGNCGCWPHWGPCKNAPSQSWRKCSLFLGKRCCQCNKHNLATLWLALWYIAIQKGASTIGCNSQLLLASLLGKSSCSFKISFCSFDILNFPAFSSSRFPSKQAPTHCGGSGLTRRVSLEGRHAGLPLFRLPIIYLAHIPVVTGAFGWIKSAKTHGVCLQNLQAWPGDAHIISAW